MFSAFSNKGKTRRGVADGGPDDDGDYATLRELPLMSSIDATDDSTSEENKVSVCLKKDTHTHNYFTKLKNQVKINFYS